jgi:hypothetical protein
LPLSSKTKRETRRYSPEICPPMPMVCTMASRLKLYWLSASRNVASLAVNSRMMRSTSTPAVEALGALVEDTCCACAAGAKTPHASTNNINIKRLERELFINFLWEFEPDYCRRPRHRKAERPFLERLRCNPRSECCQRNYPLSVVRCPLYVAFQAS